MLPRSVGSEIIAICKVPDSVITFGLDWIKLVHIE
jgi:hypothetical protein